MRAIALILLVALTLPFLRAEDKPAPFDPGGVTPTEQKARDLIDAAVKKYRAAKSYQDTLEMNMDMGADRNQKKSASNFFTAPNRLALRSDDFSLVSDGAHLWTYAPMLKQYTEISAPKQLDISELGSPRMMGSSPIHPVIAAMTQPDKSLEKLFPTFKLAPGAFAYKIKGRPGLRVDGTVEIAQIPSEKPVPLTLVFDEDGGLLNELKLDLSDAMKALTERNDADNGGGHAIGKAVISIQFSNVKLDAAIPDSEFEFKPPAGAKKVEDFDYSDAVHSTEDSVVMTTELSSQAGDENANELLGRPAPEIAATDLAGKAVSLAALKDRVVVLVFWLAADSDDALTAMKALAEKYAAKPVTIIGVNCDPRLKSADALKLLQSKNLSDRQVLDADGEIARKFKLGASTTAMLIDAKGMVADVQAKDDEDGVVFMAPKLIVRIDRLLKGESLRPIKGESTKKAEDDGNAMTELSPERLVEGDPLSGAGMGMNMYQARLFDLEGNGQQQLIAPDGMSGGLVIVSADGSSIKKLRFKGAGTQAQISAFQPVRMPAGVHWLIAFTQYGFRGGNSSTTTVRLYGPDGEAVWTFKPELPEKTNSNIVFAAGDLDGGGKPEFAIGMSTYRMKKSGANSYMQESAAAWLIVLDAAGKPLVQRRVGRSIQFVHITTPKPGELPQVLCFDDGGKVRRYSLAPAPAPAPAKKE